MKIVRGLLIYVCNIILRFYILPNNKRFHRFKNASMQCTKSKMCVQNISAINMTLTLTLLNINFIMVEE